MPVPCSLETRADEDAALAAEGFREEDRMVRGVYDRLTRLRDLLWVRLSHHLAWGAGFGAPPLQVGLNDPLDTIAPELQDMFAAARLLQSKIVKRYFEFRMTFAKTTEFIYRMACERRAFEELRSIHRLLDALDQLAGLGDTKREVWESELKAARTLEEAAMMAIARKQTLPFARNVKGHEAMEALTLMKFEIDYYPPPHNSADHVAAMKIVFFSIVRSSNGRVSKIPDWYSPPYLFRYDRSHPISGSNAVTTAFRGQYADWKVPGSPLVDVIVKRLQLDADGIEAFRQEAEQWFNMNCDHVVKLAAASHCSAPALLVLEDVKGSTLTQYLGQRGRRHELWAKFLQAAKGLQYLRYSQRTVHGNLKPTNILVDSSGRVKVTDFGRGIATLQNLAVHSGGGDQVMQWRAPEYRSPDLRPTYCGDVYSLGLCMLDALVGNFTPPTTEPPARPPKISDEGWALVEHMCESDPADRIEIDRVIGALERLAQHPMQHLGL